MLNHSNYQKITTSISTVKHAKSFFVNLIFVKWTTSFIGARAAAKCVGFIDKTILLFASLTPNIVYCENIISFCISHHINGVNCVISSDTTKHILSGSIIKTHSRVIFAKICERSGKIL